MAAIPPGLMFYWEQVSPSHVGRGGFAPVMRLAGALGGIAGFLLFYQRSLRTLLSNLLLLQVHPLQHSKVFQNKHGPRLLSSIYPELHARQTVERIVAETVEPRKLTAFIFP